MFDLRISGVVEVQLAVTSVALRALDITPAADAVYAAVQADVARRFASAPGVRETAIVYGGVPWQALTEASIRSGKREGGKQLKVTGDLLSQFEKGNPGNVAEATADTITFGSDTGKAKGIHNKRALIVAHPALVENVNDILRSYVADGVVKGL